MTALELVHVLLAITAVGANITYGVWTARAKREPEHAAFALRGVKFMDDRIANPCYVLLPITGILLMWREGYTFTNAHWAGTAFVLWVVLAGVALLLYRPALSARIRVLETEGPTSPSLPALERRGLVIGILLAVLALVIVLLMVVKPTL